jgi:hypothetical protein
MSDGQYTDPKKDVVRARDRERCAVARAKVLDHYGRECACCGESIDLFLTIDHINDDGAEHRKRDLSGVGGNVLYRWLVRKGFPTGFRTLCYNCNMARAHYGVCPHERKCGEVGRG